MAAAVVVQADLSWVELFNKREQVNHNNTHNYWGKTNSRNLTMTYLNHNPAVVEAPQTPAGEDIGLHHKVEVGLLGVGLGVDHTFDLPS